MVLEGFNIQYSEVFMTHGRCIPRGLHSMPALYASTRSAVHGHSSKHLQVAKLHAHGGTDHQQRTPRRSAASSAPRQRQPPPGKSELLPGPRLPPAAPPRALGRRPAPARARPCACCTAGCLDPGSSTQQGSAHGPASAVSAVRDQRDHLVPEDSGFWISHRKRWQLYLVYAYTQGL